MSSVPTVGTGLAVNPKPAALSNKHFSFITEEYLPKKLAAKQWLD